MKTPVALLFGALLLTIAAGCNTVDLSELPAQEELRAGPTPAPQRGGGVDDSIKPKPTLVQKGGIAPVQPVQRAGGSDDSIRPLNPNNRLAPAPPAQKPR